MPQTVKNKFSFVLVISLLFSAQVSAQLLLTAPPRETAKQGKALYGGWQYRHQSFCLLRKL